jgi:hypothetical protein
MTVTVYSQYADNTLPRLAHAMTLMPNLHTIHILGGFGIRPNQFEKAFSGLLFPSVRHVILPAPGQAILGCFPEVVEVFTNDPVVYDFSQFLDNVISHCPKVESIGWRELSENIKGEWKQRNSRCKCTSMVCA